MGIQTNRIESTFDATVLVTFANNGSEYKGDFKAVFKRPPSSLIEDILSENIAPSVLMGGDKSKGEDETGYLKSVDGIGDSKGDPMTPEQQLAWVLNSAECCGAAYLAFLAKLQQERLGGKTKK